MNIDTATVSELRDELARLMGWFRPHLSKPMPFKWYHDTHGGQNNHPVPLTLDFVATAEVRADNAVLADALRKIAESYPDRLPGAEHECCVIASGALVRAGGGE